MMMKSLLSLFLFFAALASANAQVKCPVINGRFKMPVTIDDKNFQRSYTFYTRQKEGAFSYTTNGKKDSFQRADGKPVSVQIEGRLGKISIRCGINSIIVEGQADGVDTLERIEYVMIDASTMKVDHFIKERSGVYSKDESFKSPPN